MGVGKRKRYESMFPGFAFTVGNPSRIPQATSCLIQSLQSVLSDTKESVTENGKSLSDLLAEEMDEIKSNKKRLQSAGDLCRGIPYIKLSQPCVYKPSQLLHMLLSDTKYPLPAYVARVIPYDWVTHPHLSNATNLIIKEIKPFFESIHQPSSWNLKMGKHSMGSIDKAKLLEVLIDHIPDRHEPSVMSAEWTLLVDITPVMCGMALVRDYETLFEFKIGKLQDERNKAIGLDLDQEHQID